MSQALLEEETAEIEKDDLDDVWSLDSTEESETVGLESLSEEIEKTASSFEVKDFRCTECGFAHGHDTDKHRLPDTFDVSHEEVAGMPMNPNCHCGLNFIAAYGEDYGVTDAPTPEEAAKKAPIPESARSKIRNLR